MSARAGIVVTGTEVLTGLVRDANGPWVAERLLELGVDVAQITIVGDRPEDMAAPLRSMREAGLDVIITTGGLGPTADDLTMQVVADFQGRDMALDPRLEDRIAAIVGPMTRRWTNVDRFHDLVVVRVDARQLLTRAARDPECAVVKEHRRGPAGDDDLGDRLVSVWVDARDHTLAIAHRPDAADAGRDAALGVGHFDVGLARHR